MGHTDVGDPELLAQRDDEVLFGEVFVLHQQAGQALACLPVLVDTVLELFLGYQVLLQKHIGQSLLCCACGHPCPPFTLSARYAHSVGCP